MPEIHKYVAGKLSKQASNQPTNKANRHVTGMTRPGVERRAYHSLGGTLNESSRAGNSE